MIKPTYLFLDRDGVINERLPGRYVEGTEEFQFTAGCLEAITFLSQIFERIFIVTNQQGIGKGLMTEADLEQVHHFMTEAIVKAGGRIDAIYHCPLLASTKANCRKPNPEMGLQAKRDFPVLDFGRAVMAGDSKSDMIFGKCLGMKTIFIESKPEDMHRVGMLLADQRFPSLVAYARSLGMV